MKYMRAARDVVHKLRRHPKANEVNVSNDWIREYFVTKNLKQESYLKHLYNHEDYAKYVSTTDERELNKFEKEILGQIEGGKDLYDFIWNKCTDKEKYLLYDFAYDGLMNYK